MKNLINKVTENKKMVLGLGLGVLSLSLASITILRRKKKKYNDDFDDYFLDDDELFENENTSFDYLNSCNDESEGFCEFCDYDDDVKRYLNMTEEEKQENFRHTVTLALDTILRETLLAREDNGEIIKIYKQLKSKE